jgi:hypothetical protein
MIALAIMVQMNEEEKFQRPLIFKAGKCSK